LFVTNALALFLVVVAATMLPVLRGEVPSPSWLLALALASLPILAALVGMRWHASWFVSGMAAAINFAFAVALLAFTAFALAGLGGALGLLIGLVPALVLAASNTFVLVRTFRKEWANPSFKRTRLRRAA
jgi:hypothetical protein